MMFIWRVAFYWRLFQTDGISMEVHDKVLSPGVSAPVYCSPVHAVYFGNENGNIHSNNINSLDLNICVPMSVPNTLEIYGTSWKKPYTITENLFSFLRYRYLPYIFPIRKGTINISIYSNSGMRNPEIIYS